MEPEPEQTNSAKIEKPTENHQSSRRIAWYGELPKYLAVAACLLYLFGFVIWHAYLAQYGVNPPSLWRIEFFSAALCYLTLLAAIACPAAIVLIRIFPEMVPDFIKIENISFYPLLVLYAFLLSQASKVFFGSITFLSGSMIDLVIAVLIIIQVSALPILAKRKSNGRIAKLLRHELTFAVLVLIDSFSGLLHAKRVSGIFLFATVALFFSLTLLGGYHVAAFYRMTFPLTLGRS